MVAFDIKVQELGGHSIIHRILRAFMVWRAALRIGGACTRQQSVVGIELDARELNGVFTPVGDVTDVQTIIPKFI